MLREDSLVQPFLFDDLDIRGSIVQINNAWRAMTAQRGYSPAVRAVLGELTAVTAIMSANLKQPGRLTFQMQGHGPLSLMVVDCTETLNLRGYAKTDETVSSSELSGLIGDGHLQLTLDIAGLDQPYQSLVPIEGDTVAAVFEHYLAQSEQQPAALWLVANGDTAAGLFLQKLPDADLRDADGWARVTSLAATVKPDELRSLPPEEVLARLFHEETVRVFTPRPVLHRWPADPEKVKIMLRGLGRQELESVIETQGVVEIHDDMSNHTYRFDADAIHELFSAPDAPPTQH
ncbi:MAG: Hsp33 family molecular chaperone HslO [Denitromonas halophila]|nr:MAG: Hsp33 family molecular chaperone HslO [Denitromonas halophila]TVT67480.1 MAG: Hsp33 family molecular chaperone HslO [Denitromonas halophila]TVT70248.1 MAG: Hsp33 family molecular chaperone HslO [Denitromonas halophila]